MSMLFSKKLLKRGTGTGQWEKSGQRKGGKE
jgi:hypothetical protein